MLRLPKAEAAVQAAWSCRVAEDFDAERMGREQAQPMRQPALPSSAPDLGGILGGTLEFPPLFGRIRMPETPSRDCPCRWQSGQRT
jgi:hypothetical protein